VDGPKYGLSLDQQAYLQKKKKKKKTKKIIKKKKKIK